MNAGRRCSPAAWKGLGGVANDDAAAERLKALGHPVRLAIVRELARRDCCCCADMCSRLPLAQSTVSQHLKVLRDAGLIGFSRDGVRSSYALNRAAFADLREELEEIALLVGAVSGARDKASERKPDGS